jgi:H+-transporting ATPase
VIGFVEERRAGDAISALKNTLAQQAMVCRENKWYTIEAAELVPGDLIRLCIGDLIPADCILQKGKKLEVDQSGTKFFLLLFLFCFFLHIKFFFFFVFFSFY